MHPDLEAKHEARMKEEQRAALLDGRALLQEAFAHPEEVEQILSNSLGISGEVAECRWVGQHYGDTSPEHLANHIKQTLGSQIELRTGHFYPAKAPQTIWLRQLLRRRLYSAGHAAIM